MKSLIAILPLALLIGAAPGWVSAQSATSETGRQGCCKTCGQVRGDEKWQTGALRPEGDRGSHAH